MGMLQEQWDQWPSVLNTQTNGFLHNVLILCSGCQNARYCSSECPFERGLFSIPFCVRLTGSITNSFVMQTRFLERTIMRVKRDEVALLKMKVYPVASRAVSLLKVARAFSRPSDLLLTCFLVTSDVCGCRL